MGKSDKEIVLETRNLTVKIAKMGSSQTTTKLIDDLSFKMHRGSITALLGESGAGKSLFALTVLGLLMKPPFLPPEGAVLFHGENLLELSERRLKAIRGKKISLIFQEPKNALNPVFPIGEQLIEMIDYQNLSENEKKEKVLAALDEVQLLNAKNIFNAYPHELSGGMLQRVMIAMAVLADPEILIADEPTTSLDVTIQAQILELLETLREKKNLSILIITHDLGVVAEIADEVCVLYSGKLVEQGPTLDIFDHPAHPYTTELFNARYFSPKMKRFSQSFGKEKISSGCAFQHRCPFVMPHCLKTNPELFLLKNKSQSARCFLYDPNLEARLDYDEELSRS